MPSAALSAIELAVMGAGVPCVGFYAQVPHYVGGPFASGAIALLEHVERHLGVEVGLGSLPEDALAQRQRLDAAIEGDENTQAYVAQLEAGLEQERIPSGDELASEIERFLRDADGGERAGAGREPGAGSATPRRELRSWREPSGGDAGSEAVPSTRQPRCPHRYYRGGCHVEDPAGDVGGPRGIRARRGPRGDGGVRPRGGAAKAAPEEDDEDLED